MCIRSFQLQTMYIPYAYLVVASDIWFVFRMNSVLWRTSNTQYSTIDLHWFFVLYFHLYSLLYFGILLVCFVCTIATMCLVISYRFFSMFRGISVSLRYRINGWIVLLENFCNAPAHTHTHTRLCQCASYLEKDNDKVDICMSMCLQLMYTHFDTSAAGTFPMPNRKE